MQSSVLLFAVFALASARAPIDDDGKIVGGQNVPAGMALYQASLRRSDGGHFCGGAVLNARWAITAAHCIYENRVSYIVVGTKWLSSGGVRYNVVAIAWYRYDPATHQNDIALLKTDRLIAMNSFVQPVALPTADAAPGTFVLVTGWGYKSNPGLVSDYLQMLAVKVLTNADCAARWYPTPIFGGDMCTLARSANQGVCFGDSGGPVVTAGGQLVGVASRMKPCAVGLPDVHTRITAYLGWIRQVIVT